MSDITKIFDKRGKSLSSYELNGLQTKVFLAMLNDQDYDHLVNHMFAQYSRFWDNLSKNLRFYDDTGNIPLCQLYENQPMIRFLEKLQEKIKENFFTQPVITAEIFLEKTGHLPTNDDVDRCNCKDIGKPGHSACGWCPEHDLPRFMCGCRNYEKFD